MAKCYLAGPMRSKPQFNYPAFTVETNTGVPVGVRWRNELVAIDPGTGFPCDGTACARTFLPHLLPVDIWPP